MGFVGEEVSLLKENSLTNTSKRVKNLNWSEIFVWSGYSKFGGGVDIIKLAVKEEIIGERIRDPGFIAEDLQMRYLQVSTRDSAGGVRGRHLHTTSRCRCRARSLACAVMKLARVLQLWHGMVSAGLRLKKTGSSADLRVLEA